MYALVPYTHSRDDAVLAENIKLGRIVCVDDAAAADQEAFRHVGWWGGEKKMITLEDQKNTAMVRAYNLIARGLSL